MTGLSTSQHAVAYPLSSSRCSSRLFQSPRTKCGAIVDHLQDDRNCDRFGYQVTYFPYDTFPGLDVHRINQCKSDLYQVDLHGCRPTAIYIHLIIMDSAYVDVKVINYQASEDFKFPMESYSYPVIPLHGTTFKEDVEEAVGYMQRVSGMTVGPPDVKILT